ncbi:hypothetical protein HXX76_000834 [Chlamydomonas incerta]|uniref:Uncharacterized protein n=1 Tax=Chlamydomonas incerta TaxID=51695 RepID=A0A836B363_CHLIN|nr:hypothetical protein HXX76_000834 [Chlamydomonas incerta]|eukprot:KAG2446242.1 hypothetical protein HXX76_000834 [Chlamydomonas incerta]
MKPEPQPQPQQQPEDPGAQRKCKLRLALRHLGVPQWRVDCFKDADLDLLLAAGIEDAAALQSNGVLVAAVRAGLDPVLVGFIDAAQASSASLGLALAFLLLVLAGLLLHGTALGHQIEMAAVVLATLTFMVLQVSRT